MKEIQKNNLLQITIANGKVISGCVLDFLEDRVLVQVDKECCELAKALKELDEFRVCVQTVLGKRNMDSCLICELNENNRLVIENADSIAVECQRNHVRVDCDFDFVIKVDNNIANARATNISGGGIAFEISRPKFEKNDIITIVLPAKLFGKMLECELKVLKMDSGDRASCAGQFVNLSIYKEDTIVKYTFSKMAEGTNDKKERNIFGFKRKN